ncbi:MAG: diaminopimelate epimerase [Saprospiraceae bacterium]
MISFVKYQGAGNDFILIDQRRNEWIQAGDKHLVARLCDRRFGIGADGLILLRESAEADFEMVYFNSDGGLSTFCGNGGRCVAAFAASLGIIGQKTRFRAADGIHEAEIRGAGADMRVRLSMRDLRQWGRDGDALTIDTGSPHYVQFVEQVADIDVGREGAAVRYAEPYVRFGGINVNFVSETGPGAIAIRTYERGVEAETLACGTGVTAAALAYAIRRDLYGDLRIAVAARGGDLSVDFWRDASGFSQVWLEGPAVRVFEGKIPAEE